MTVFEIDNRRDSTVVIWAFKSFSGKVGNVAVTVERISIQAYCLGLIYR